MYIVYYICKYNFEIHLNMCDVAVLLLYSQTSVISAVLGRTKFWPQNPRIIEVQITEV